MELFFGMERITDHLKTFQDKLLAWYQAQARDLPWRRNPTPYHVWVSEVMLQQTRVETAIVYFQRFIASVPNIRALSELSDDHLLKLWQGLGYYRRAMYLKKAARIMVQKYHGQMPADYKKLLALPGIGTYSAGAIASIAFGHRVAAVDGNVLRVMARVTGNKNDISQLATRKQIHGFVEKLLPLESIGDFNQALMELGAKVCLPGRAPKCGKCPASQFCYAGYYKMPAEIPVKSPKRKRTIVKKTVLIMVRGQRIALQKRKKTGLLANLWELPNQAGHLTEQQCKRKLKQWGITAQTISAKGPLRHIFTHLEWRMQGYHILVSEVENATPWVWATKREIDELYSIPSAFKGFMQG